MGRKVADTEFEDDASKMHPPSALEPRNEPFLSLHRRILPLVNGPRSLRYVATFQRTCGLSGDGRITNFLLYGWFRIASAAGEEIFSLMPLLIWLAFPVAVPFVTNFMVLLIVGQLAKDCLMLPRPLSPPTCPAEERVVKLDSRFETEYGMPSTHTISGFLPQVVMLALSRLCGVEFSAAAWAVSAVYTSSVALSRLYLGVHSVYDIIGGALIAAVLMALLHRYGDALDVLLYASQGSALLIAAAALLFLCLYPRPKPWSAAYGTSAQIFGSWLGTALSFHYIFAYRPDIHCALLRASVAPVCSAGCGSAFFGAGAAPAGSDDAAAVCAAASVPAQLLVYRMLLSLLIAGLCKVVGKMIPSALFDWLFRSGVLRPHPEELRDGFGQAVPRHKAYYFEVPVRLINYGSLGIATVVLCPLCWQLLLPDGDANH